MSVSYSPAEAEAATRVFIDMALSLPKIDLAMTGLLSAFASIATAPNSPPQLLACAIEPMEEALRVFKDITHVRAALKH